MRKLTLILVGLLVIALIDIYGICFFRPTANDVCKQLTASMDTKHPEFEVVECGVVNR